MSKFESYHIIGFVLAYISLYYKSTIKMPQIQTSQFAYILTALLPLFAVIGTTSADSLEHISLVLSYAFAQHAVGNIIKINEISEPLNPSNKKSATISQYMHMTFLISVLMLIYNGKVNMYMGYALLFAFTTFSFMNNKINTSNALRDYVIIHLLFFFTK